MFEISGGYLFGLTLLTIIVGIGLFPNSIWFNIYND